MNIVCWGETKQTNSKIIADFHFNYWPKSIFDKNQETPYLDIGVMFHSYENLEAICFWFPAGKDDIVWRDLGELLKDSLLATLIFNNKISATTSVGDHPKQFTLTKTNKGESFIVYQLANENISQEACYDGVLFKIKLQSIVASSDQTPIYIRFRLESLFLNKINHVIKAKNKFFQSAFVETSYIDFRFNDVRSMNDSLQEHIAQYTAIQPRKIHFLLMTRSDEELIPTSIDQVSTRTLETTLWKKYIGHELDCICLANHWRFDLDPSSSELEKCTICARYKVNHCNWSTIFIYIAVLFLLTIAFNLFSSFIYGYLHYWKPLFFL